MKSAVKKAAAGKNEINCNDLNVRYQIFDEKVSDQVDRCNSSYGKAVSNFEMVTRNLNNIQSCRANNLNNIEVNQLLIEDEKKKKNVKVRYAGYINFTDKKLSEDIDSQRYIDKIKSDENVSSKSGNQYKKKKRRRYKIRFFYDDTDGKQNIKPEITFIDNDDKDVEADPEEIERLKPVLNSIVKEMIERYANKQTGHPPFVEVSGRKYIDTDIDPAEFIKHKKEFPAAEIGEYFKKSSSRPSAKLDSSPIITKRTSSIKQKQSDGKVKASNQEDMPVLIQKKNMVPGNPIQNITPDLTQTYESDYNYDPIEDFVGTSDLSMTEDKNLKLQTKMQNLFISQEELAKQKMLSGSKNFDASFQPEPLKTPSMSPLTDNFENKLNISSRVSSISFLDSQINQPTNLSHESPARIPKAGYEPVNENTRISTQDNHVSGESLDKTNLLKQCQEDGEKLSSYENEKVAEDVKKPAFVFSISGQESYNILKSKDYSEKKPPHGKHIDQSGQSCARAIKVSNSGQNVLHRKNIDDSGPNSPDSKNMDSGPNSPGGKNRDHSGKDSLDSKNMDYSGPNSPQGKNRDHSGPNSLDSKNMDYSGPNSPPGKNRDHSRPNSPPAGKNRDYSGPNSPPAGKNRDHSGPNSPSPGKNRDHSGPNSPPGKNRDHSGPNSPPGKNRDHSGPNSSRSKNIEHSGKGSSLDQNIDSSGKGYSRDQNIDSSGKGYSRDQNIDSSGKGYSRDQNIDSSGKGSSNGKNIEQIVNRIKQLKKAPGEDFDKLSSPDQYDNLPYAKSDFRNFSDAKESLEKKTAQSETYQQSRKPSTTVEKSPYIGDILTTLNEPSSSLQQGVSRSKTEDESKQFDDDRLLPETVTSKNIHGSSNVKRQSSTSTSVSYHDEYSLNKREENEAKLNQKLSSKTNETGSTQEKSTNSKSKLTTESQQKIKGNDAPAEFLNDECFFSENDKELLNFLYDAVEDGVHDCFETIMDDLNFPCGTNGDETEKISKQNNKVGLCACGMNPIKPGSDYCRECISLILNAGNCECYESNRMLSDHLPNFCFTCNGLVTLKNADTLDKCQSVTSEDDFMINQEKASQKDKMRHILENTESNIKENDIDHDKFMPGSEKTASCNIKSSKSTFKSDKILTNKKVSDLNEEKSDNQEIRRDNKSYNEENLNVIQSAATLSRGEEITLKNEIPNLVCNSFRKLSPSKNTSDGLISYVSENAPSNQIKPRIPRQKQPSLSHSNEQPVPRPRSISKTEIVNDYQVRQHNEPISKFRPEDVLSDIKTESSIMGDIGARWWVGNKLKSGSKSDSSRPRATPRINAESRYLQPTMATIQNMGPKHSIKELIYMGLRNVREEALNMENRLSNMKN